jgi:hypothetical protein
LSEDEKFLIQGRALNEYAEIKKTLGALTAKASGYATEMQRVVWYIQPSNNSYTQPFSGRMPVLDNLPTSQQLHEVLTAIQEAKNKKRELQDRLKEFGVEVKD